MAILVKHSKVSTIPDDTDTSLIRPSDWNADHTLTGTIDIANGGTGQTSANAAFNALVPSQTGNSGKYLTTDGTDTSWATNPLGTVTSVAATAGTGISVTGSPITTSGTLNITNTAPDQTVVLNSGTGISTSGTYPNFTVTNTAPDQTVSIANGTGISTTGTYPAFTVTNTGVTSAVAGTGISVSGSTGAVTVTNTAPDQTVALTGAGTTVVTGTYPNFTITSNDEHDGDVVGPASATDNALARFDTTTGKLIQNSLVIVDDTGSVTGVNSLTAESLTVNNNATLGSSNTDTLDVNARITTDLEPNANNAKDIGTSGRNWRDGFFGRTLHTVNIEVSGTTSFDGQQGTNGQVLTSAGTGNTPTWTTPTTGTVTSVSATAGTGISVSGSPITTSGTLTITNTAPDQTVAIASGTGISVTGTYPNFTVTNTSPSSGGTVTSVTGTAPVVSSGGNTPAISMAQATGSVDGYLSATDWTTFNNKAAPFTYTSTYIPFGQGTTTPNQSANLTFDGTTQSAPVQRASNGIVTNNKTIGTSFTIPDTDNAMSSGPVTISSGVTVTVSSGSRWVVL